MRAVVFRACSCRHDVDAQMLTAPRTDLHAASVGPVGPLQATSDARATIAATDGFRS